MLLHLLCTGPMCTKPKPSQYSQTASSHQMVKHTTFQPLSIKISILISMHMITRALSTSALSFQWLMHSALLASVPQSFMSSSSMDGKLQSWTIYNTHRFDHAYLCASLYLYLFVYILIYMSESLILNFYNALMCFLMQLASHLNCH